MQPLKLMDEQVSLYFVEVVESEETDQRELESMMAILFMMCSTIVYCTSGLIDDKAFLRLAAIKELRNIIQVYEADKHLSDMYIESYAPYFIWNLHDSSEVYKDAQGNYISCNCYLESKLVESGSKVPDVEHIKNLFVNIFKRRSCVDLTSWSNKFSSPKETEQHIDTSLRQPILLNSRLRKLENKALTAKEMATYVYNLIDAINRHAVVNPAELLDVVSDIELKEALQNAKLAFAKLVKENFGGTQFHPRETTLEEKLTLMRTQALVEFSQGIAAEECEHDQLQQALADLDAFVGEREQAIRIDQKNKKVL